MLQKATYQHVSISRTRDIPVRYLADVIKRMVNQRAYIIEHVSKSRDMAPIRSIEKVRNMMEFVKGKPMRAHCNIIIAIEADLLALLPTPSSRFYPEVNNKVLDIIEYAKKYIAECKQ